MSDSPITKIERVGYNVLFTENDWRVAVPVYGYTRADDSYVEVPEPSDTAIYLVVDGVLSPNWADSEPTSTVFAAYQSAISE